jgi:deoxyribonuclease V
MAEILQTPELLRGMTAEDLSTLPDLDLALTALVGQIPPGRVATYGTLARALGNVVAAKWVGHRLLHHPHNRGCHCHRVVRAGGALGGFVGDSDEKLALLRSEGVEVHQRCIDLHRYGFDDFQTDQPLLRLQQAQEALRARVIVRPPPSWPKHVGGVDVSYGTHSEDATAAYTLLELATGKLLWSTTIRRRVTFPYISSYLAFRELPILLELLREVAGCVRLADVIMVDGSGVLHPRQAGVATMLGVVLQWPTIGVTKKRLIGQVSPADSTSGDWLPMMHDGQLLGAAMLPRTSTTKPLYVSPGHLMDLESSVRIVQALLLRHRLPEPLYLADRLSRRQQAGATRHHAGI